MLVLAAPMYNFAIPSSLKSWFDHVLRAGLTFRYAEQGPEGLLQGKRAFVLTARGGIYAGGGLDHQEPYLRQVLGFVGIHDVTFIHAEGMNMGPEFREKAWREPASGCCRRWKRTLPFASLCQRSGDWTQHPVEPLPRVFDRFFISRWFQAPDSGAQTVWQGLSRWRCRIDTGERRQGQRGLLQGGR